jgi:hypothetical protein
MVPVMICLNFSGIAISALLAKNLFCATVVCILAENFLQNKTRTGENKVGGVKNSTNMLVHFPSCLQSRVCAQKTSKRMNVLNALSDSLPYPQSCQKMAKKIRHSKNKF